MGDNAIADGYTIETIRDIDGFRRLAPALDAIVARSRCRGIFIMAGWLDVWMRHYLHSEDRLFVQAVYKGQELVAVAPWYVRQARKGWLRWRSVEFLGGHGVGSDYLEVVVVEEHARNVAQRLYQHLYQEAANEWDCLYFTDVPADSSFFDVFWQLSQQSGKHVDVVPGALCPTAVLPDTWHAYLASLSSNRRAQFQRHARVLARSGEVQRHAITPRHPRYAEYCSRLCDLHRARWPLQPPIFYRFLADVLRDATLSDTIELQVLEVDARPIAMMLHFSRRDVVYMYITVVDREFNPKISVGNLALGQVLEAAIQSGIRCYDFLRGGEAYKFHWANSAVRSLNLLACQRRASTLLLQLARCGRNSLKSFTR